MQKEKDDHEIRIKSNQPTKNYINRAAILLLRDQLELKEGESKEAPLDYVIFQASGKAINTALVAADIIRRKIPGLHQINRIKTIMVHKEKRSDDDSDEKALAVFEAVVHKNPSAQEKKEPGYLGLLDGGKGDSFKLEDIIQRGQGQRRGYSGSRNVRNRQDSDTGGRNYNRRYNQRQYRKGSNESYNDRRPRGQRENYRQSRRNQNGEERGGGGGGRRQQY